MLFATWDSNEAVPPATKCKHGAYRCDRCGTSDRTDKLHATLNGRGRVARLRRKDAGLRLQVPDVRP